MNRLLPITSPLLKKVTKSIYPKVQITKFSSLIDAIAELPNLPERNNIKHVKENEPIDSIYQKPKRIQTKHQIISCNLHFRSYLPSIMDFYVDFVQRVAYEMQLPCSGMAYLPTKIERWAVPKSPFIHKKRQEVFERKTHKRLLQITDANTKTLEFLLEYINKNLPPGVGIRVDRYEYEEVDNVVKALEKKKVELSDITPKAKILADAILTEMKKNPNANMYDVGIRLHKEIFGKELPIMDFVSKPKDKNQKAEGKETTTLKGKKK